MKKIIFDLDGTLLNSRKRHEVVLGDSISQYGMLPPKSISDYVEKKREGINTYCYLKEYLNYNDELAKRISEIWTQNIEQEHYLVLDKLYKDSIPCLETLRNSYDLILVSARKNQNGLFEQLQKLNIEHYFYEVICVSPVNAKEKKIEAIEKYKMQVCLVVGDTEVDYACAKYYFLPVYILNRGFRSQYYWDKKGVNSFYDLTSLINKFNSK